MSLASVDYGFCLQREAFRIEERWGDAAASKQEHDTFATSAQQLSPPTYMSQVRLSIATRIWRFWFSFVFISSFLLAGR